MHLVAATIDRADPIAFCGMVFSAPSKVPRLLTVGAIAPVLRRVCFHSSQYSVPPVGEKRANDEAFTLGVVQVSSC